MMKYPASAYRMEWKAIILLLMSMALPMIANGQATVTLSPIPHVQFLSNAGIPLASGCVNTYIAGTTTPQTTYRDSGGVNTNTNPIILNAGGFADIWLDVTKSYKFTVVSAGGVNCSTGSTQWTVDNITVPSINALLASNNTWTGNQTFNGSVTYGGSTTFNSLTLSGALTANGGGALNGTFSGTRNDVGINTSCQLNGVLYVGGSITCWSGSDIGAQINTAYAALPATGGTINILCQSSRYDFSTPIVFGTSAKPVLLQGLCPGGYNVSGPGGSVILNYTPTTATSAITLNFAQIGGSGGMSGAGLRDFALFNNNCTTPNGCGSSAIGIQIGNSNGGAGHADYRNLNIAGWGTGVNSTTSSAAWGSTWTNIEFLNNTTAMNYPIGLENTNIIGSRFLSNGTSMSIAPGEYFVWGTSFDSCGTVCINSTGSLGTGYFQCTSCHFENTNLGTTHNFTGNGNNITLIGGMMEDDITSTTGDYFITVAAGEVSIYGTKLLSAGQTLSSPIVCNTGCRANVTAVNYSPGFITAVDGAHNMVQGTSNAIIDLSYNINSSNAAAPSRFDSGGFIFPNGIGMKIIDNTSSHVRTIGIGPNVTANDFAGMYDYTGAKVLWNQSWISPFQFQIPGPIDLTEVAAPSALSGFDRVWGGSDDHMLHYNPNNAGVQQIPISGMVTSTYTNATTTPSNITGLSFAVAANRNYSMDCNIFYQGSATTAGLDITITGPASPTSIIYSYEEHNAATTLTESVATAFGTKLVGGTITATTNFTALVIMGLRNGANAGTVQVQGSATGAGTVTIQPGSYCQLQ